MSGKHYQLLLLISSILLCLVSRIQVFLWTFMIFPELFRKLLKKLRQLLRVLKNIWEPSESFRAVKRASEMFSEVWANSRNFFIQEDVLGTSNNKRLSSDGCKTSNQRFCTVWVKRVELRTCQTRTSDLVPSLLLSLRENTGQIWPNYIPRKQSDLE